MARKAKRKLPKHVRQAIEQRDKEERAAEAIAPMRTTNPVLQRPPGVNQPAPKALPAPAHLASDEDDVPSLAQGQPALPPPTREDAEHILQKAGARVLVGREADDACTFWIDLNEDYLDGVTIRVTLKPGRRITARLIVSSSQTEAYIRKHIAQLHTRLQRRGLHLDEVEVIVP